MVGVFLYYQTIFKNITFYLTELKSIVFSINPS